MRITEEMLHKFAQDAVNLAAANDHTLVAAYLYGSMLYGSPLLGGAGDIDLVYIHLNRPKTKREIIRLTEDLHLDIEHHYQTGYQQARDLRTHPWMGPTLRDAQILHDPQHFMDFVQASVRGMFDRPETVLERARPLSESARQTWMDLNFSPPPSPSPADVKRYLCAIQEAANAVSLLSGNPVCGRRMLLEFTERADAIGKPGLYHGLIGLLGGHQADVDQLTHWLEQWKESFDRIDTHHASQAFQPERKSYYVKAFDILISSDRPLNVLWPLLETWTELTLALNTDEQTRNEYTMALTDLGLLGDGFYSRIDAFDKFLDLIEETLDDWAAEYGV